MKYVTKKAMREIQDAVYEAHHKQRMMVEVSTITLILDEFEEMAQALGETADCLEDMASGKGGWAWEEVVEQARSFEADSDE